jgi:hypothetical protein
MDPESLLARIEYLEENRRLIQNALEMALSLGDFQKNINKGYKPENILREAEKRVQYLIPFEANAFYLVDQEKSDFVLSVCEPSEKTQFIEDQVSYLIDKGFFACYECHEFETCGKLRELHGELHYEASLRNMRAMREKGLEAWLAEVPRH